jgi:pentatricopeptide repeat protein
MLFGSVTSDLAEYTIIGSQLQTQRDEVIIMIVTRNIMVYITSILEFPFACLIADLLSRWARRGDVWEAADLMKQMKEDGVPPNIHTYTSYINACCKAGDMQV